MLNTQEREFAKRTGYKNKSGNWIDKQGFIVSESEIKDFYKSASQWVEETRQKQIDIREHGYAKTLLSKQDNFLFA